MVDVKKLKAAMVSAGYNQTSFADELNLSVNTLNAKVNGRAKITTDEAKKMCEILHIDNMADKVQIFLA